MTRRNQIYGQLNDPILDESFIMFVSPNPLLMVASSGVNAIGPHMHGGWGFSDTWLAAGGNLSWAQEWRQL
jgi:hypothetical protein